MLRFFKKFVVLLGCICVLGTAVLLGGCNPESAKPDGAQTVKAAWNDIVVGRSVSAESITVQSSVLSSFRSVLQRQENVTAVLDICAKLDVSAMESGSSATDIISSAAIINLLTDYTDPSADSIMLCIAADGRFTVSLQRGESIYYAHGQSDTLTKENFTEFFQFTEQAE